MKKEDFLMRILEEMAQHVGRMLARALSLQKQGEHHEAHSTISEAIQDLTKLTTAQLLQLDFDVVLEKLKQLGVWEERAAYLGKLLKQDADIYEAEGDDTAVYRRKSLALQLWLSLESHADDALVQQDEVHQLIQELDEFQHLGELYHQIMTFYIAQKQFDEAENTLFDWLESEVALEDLDQFNAMDMGLEFYEMLETLDDVTLEKGGLPKAEVDRGKQELLSFFEEE